MIRNKAVSSPRFTGDEAGEVNFQRGVSGSEMYEITRPLPARGLAAWRFVEVSSKVSITESFMVINRLALALFRPLSTHSRPLTVTNEFREASFGFLEEGREILISFKLHADKSL